MGPEIGKSEMDSMDQTGYVSSEGPINYRFVVVTLWRDQDSDPEDDQRDPKSEQIWSQMR